MYQNDGMEIWEALCNGTLFIRKDEKISSSIQNWFRTYG